MAVCSCSAQDLRSSQEAYTKVSPSSFVRGHVARRGSNVTVYKSMTSVARRGRVRANDSAPRRQSINTPVPAGCEARLEYLTSVSLFRLIRGRTSAAEGAAEGDPAGAVATAQGKSQLLLIFGLPTGAAAGAMEVVRARGDTARAAPE